MGRYWRLSRKRKLQRGHSFSRVSVRFHFVFKNQVTTLDFVLQSQSVSVSRPCASITEITWGADLSLEQESDGLRKKQNSVNFILMINGIILLSAYISRLNMPVLISEENGLVPDPDPTSHHVSWSSSSYCVKLLTNKQTQMSTRPYFSFLRFFSVYKFNYLCSVDRTDVCLCSVLHLCEPVLTQADGAEAPHSMKRMRSKMKIKQPQHRSQRSITGHIRHHRPNVKACAVESISKYNSCICSDSHTHE